MEAPNDGSTSDEQEREKWINKLKKAFSDVDQHQRGFITKSQFLKSDLKYVLAEEPMTDEELLDFFDQINSNADDIVSWEQIIDFLMVQQKTLKEAKYSRTMSLEYDSPDKSVLAQFHRSAKYINYWYYESMHQIVALTETSLVFWSINTYSVVTKYEEDNETFVDFVVIPPISRIAVATASRKILFYDIKTNKPTKEYISATTPDDVIPHMTMRESKQQINLIDSKSCPIACKTSSLGYHPTLPIFYVGDQEGYVEVFEAKADQKKGGFYYVRKIKKKVHSGSVNQISFVESLDSMVSVAGDGSIALWNYRDTSNRFDISLTYTVPGERALTSFEYDYRSKSLFFTTSQHYIGVWHAYTRSSTLIETTCHRVISKCLVNISKETAFILTVSEHNLVNVYSMPHLKRIGSWYLGEKHRICPPTVLYQIDSRIYMIGAYMTCWRIVSNETNGMKPHKDEIIKMVMNNKYLMVSGNEGYLTIWNPKNGSKEFSMKFDYGRVKCVDFDGKMRRIAIGCSDNTVRILAANTGTLLFTLNSKHFDGEPTAVKFGTIGSSTLLIVASSNTWIYRFDDLPGHRIRWRQTQKGHSEEVESITFLKNLYMLTISIGTEVFLWSLKGLAIKYKLNTAPTVASDLSDPKCFIIGDVIGNVHIMSIKQQQPIKTIDVFGMVKNAPISAITKFPETDTVVIGNKYGYVGIMNKEFDEIVTYRAHSDAVTSLCVSDDYEIIVSSGLDGEVIFYSIQSECFIGALAKFKKFSLDNESTYIVEQPVPDNPFLFPMPPEEEEQNEALSLGQKRPFLNRNAFPLYNAKSQAVFAIFKKDERPQFDINFARDVMNKLDDMCDRNGLKRTQVDRMFERAKMEEAKKERPPPPPRFEDHELSLYNEDGVIKQIFKPKKNQTVSYSPIKSTLKRKRASEVNE